MLHLAICDFDAAEDLQIVWEISLLIPRPRTLILLKGILEDALVVL